MTAVDVEPDTITHLDWSVPCEHPRCQHQHPPATHAVHIHLCPCKRLMLCCTPCVARLLTYIAQNPEISLFVCVRCYGSRQARAADIWIPTPLDPR